MQFTPSQQLYPFESRWLESSVGPCTEVCAAIRRRFA
jgi:hypothetical protein